MNVKHAPAQKPSRGRVVDYREPTGMFAHTVPLSTGKLTRVEEEPTGTLRTARVLKVNADGSVDLNYDTPGTVRFAPAVTEGTEPGQWSWPERIP